MSNPVGVEPKRARGRLRVEAVLDAATVLFAERGFEGTTMTEVAARSRTAVGSLYRFFPNKTALAEALSLRYAAAFGERLDALRGQAAEKTPAALADNLVDLMIDRRRQRAALATLLDETDDGRRAALRARIAEGLAAILRAASGGASADRYEAAAQVVLQMMKAVARLYSDGGAEHPAMGELRRAIALYLEDVLAAQ